MSYLLELSELESQLALTRYALTALEQGADVDFLPAFEQTAIGQWRIIRLMQNITDDTPTRSAMKAQADDLLTRYTAVLSAMRERLRMIVVAAGEKSAPIIPAILTKQKRRKLKKGAPARFNKAQNAEIRRFVETLDHMPSIIDGEYIANQYNAEKYSMARKLRGIYRELHPQT